jgi:hypothetical protein
LVVEAPPAAQVFAAQRLSYPEAGKVTLPWKATGAVPVFVRTLGGAEVRTVSCPTPPAKKP